MERNSGSGRYLGGKIDNFGEGFEMGVSERKKGKRRTMKILDGKTK